MHNFYSKYDTKPMQTVHTNQSVYFSRHAVPIPQSVACVAALCSSAYFTFYFLTSNNRTSPVCPWRLLAIFFPCAVKLAKFRLVKNADCTVKPQSAKLSLYEQEGWNERGNTLQSTSSPHLFQLQHCRTAGPWTPSQSCGNLFKIYSFF